jgi:Holliday junction resolvase RusA-like endonuclease
VSVNKKYHLSKGRFILTQDYRDFKRLIRLSAFPCKVEGHIKMTIRFDFKSRLDIDNPCKPLIDSLQDAGIFNNDNQIKELHIYKDMTYDCGKLTVDIEEL